ncbi:hypothetical protein V6N13_061549 [Hibiscus sabdariffa]
MAIGLIENERGSLDRVSSIVRRASSATPVPVPAPEAEKELEKASNGIGAGRRALNLKVAGKRHLREPSLEEKPVVQFRYSSSSARRKKREQELHPPAEKARPKPNVDLRRALAGPFSSSLPKPSLLPTNGGESLLTIAGMVVLYWLGDGTLKERTTSRSGREANVPSDTTAQGQASDLHLSQAVRGVSPEFTAVYSLSVLS